MIIFNIVIIMIISKPLNFSFPESSTLSVILTGFTGFTLLYHLCKPFNIMRFSLFFGMLFMFVFQVIFFRNWYSLSKFTISMVVVMIVLMIITYILTGILNNIVAKIINKKKGKIV